MNGKNINELFNNTIILKQNTNVRSYFIIKFILLLNLDELYNFIKKGLVVNDNRLMKLGQLINNSKQYFISQKIIYDKCNSTIKTIRDSNNSNFILNTMRMTIQSI
jgi:hypothetical protein